MGIIDDILDFFSGVIDSIGDAITNALGNFFGSICYFFVSILCNLVKLVYNFFAVFAGLRTVEYDGESRYLINIFFNNHSIHNIYWAMAVLGFVFIIVFTVIAVIKKMFDINDKQQQSLGSIMLGALKSVLTILLLTAVLSTVINITNLLVERVSYIFDNADSLDKRYEMDFTDEQYATMARIYNTIGNYSLNPSYNSRYNLNACYNAIRSDLLSLKKDGVFDFYYKVDSSNPRSWQSELQNLIIVYDPQYEVKIDDYNIVSSTVLGIMEELKTNPDFYPVSHVRQEYVTTSASDTSLDRVIFLIGTMNASRGGYNAEPSITDPIRGPFYRGEKSIYSKSQVSAAFDISISGISYLMIALMAWFTLKNLVLCIFNCISRLFNLIGLYIIAPPIVATSPLDGGEKFKQWIISATVQMFGIFGSIIPMRLVILFIPMILDEKLVLFANNTIMNVLAKALFIVGATEAANNFGQMLTGILANNAGNAALRANDMSSLAGRTFAAATGAVASTAGFAANATGLGWAGRAIGDKFSSMADTVKNKGGLILGSIRGIHDWRKEGKSERAEKNLKQRKDSVEMAKLERDEQEFGLNGKSSSGKNKPLPPNIGKK